ncbi:MAG: tetratricopeptide repeat protein [Saprospiraceae bacterium]|nr:tetratricopeptide repeat protein [Saprospiraceae bacterium]
MNAGWTQKTGQEFIDSLKKELAKPISDSLRFDLLLKISNEYSYIDPNQGIVFGKQAMDLAEQLKDPNRLQNGYSILGLNYDNKSELSLAAENYFNALKWSEHSGSKRGQAANLSNLAGVFIKDKKYSKALDYLHSAVQINREINEREFLSINFINIGHIYLELKQTDSAKINLLEALRITREIKNELNETITLANIAQLWIEEKKYSQAFSDLHSALKLAKANKDVYMEAVLNTMIGSLYATIALDTSNISTLPINKKQALTLAFDFLHKGRQMCENMGIQDQQGKAEENLFLLYSHSGDFENALNHYKKYIGLKDSIFSLESKMQISRLETKREIDIREKQIEIDKLAVEKKRNERTYFLAGIIGLLCIIGIVVRNYLQQKKTNLLLSKEKERSEELLLNILPSEVAEELKQKGEADATLFEEVSILFTDFKGFTAVSEILTPQELVRDLHECFTAFDHIMHKYGLEKIKTIGDAYMAAGGLPTLNQTHAQDVVRAALEIRDFIEVGKKKKIENKQAYFEIRIGIHTGPVVAGIVGVKKYSYDIWGDTVNIAARMETSGEVGKVNISQSTYEKVKNLFSCTYRGKIEAKNKGNIDMYFVEC